MVGFNAIGNNSLKIGTKVPSFGSSATPSFGNNVEYHDEFVSSHEDEGLTAKKIGFITLVGLVVGGAVALLFKKPQAVEQAGNVVEVRLKDGIFDRIGGIFRKTPEERLAKAESKKAKIEAAARIKEAKIEADARIKTAKEAGEQPGVATRAWNWVFGKKAPAAPATHTRIDGLTPEELNAGLDHLAKTVEENLPDGKKLCTTFDDSGRKTLEEFKLPDGKIEKSMKYSYTFKDGEAVSVECIEYDGSGNVVKTTTMPVPKADPLSDIDKQGIAVLDATEKGDHKTRFTGSNFEEYWKVKRHSLLEKLNEAVDGELKQAISKGNDWLQKRKIDKAYVGYMQARAKTMGYNLVEIKSSGKYKLEKI